VATVDVSNGPAEEASEQVGGRWSWVVRDDPGLALGWLLVAAGVAAIVAGYLGLRTQPDVLGQMPYVVTGGLGGLALVAAGGIVIGSAGMRQTNQRLGRLEQALVALEEEILGEFDLIHAGQDGPVVSAARHRATTDV
jgi:hypothetical protein